MSERLGPLQSDLLLIVWQQGVSSAWLGTRDAALQVEFEGPQEVEAARVLPRRVVELSEGQLGDMSEACRAAGLESLFLLALKIERDEPCEATGS